MLSETKNTDAFFPQYHNTRLDDSRRDPQQQFSLPAPLAPSELVRMNAAPAGTFNREEQKRPSNHIEEVDRLTNLFV